MKFQSCSNAALIIVLSTVVLSSSVYGQVDEPLPMDDPGCNDSTIPYVAEFFTEYQPVTLSDMIRYIPGGVTILNGLRQNRQSRGMGSNGAQILIDGKRMSGKANDISGQLTRIQAGQVARIDLIRGTAEGLDIRNEGILINVILKDGGKNSSSTYVELAGQYNSMQDAVPELLLSHSGSRGKLNYGISYNLDRFLRAYDNLEHRMTPAREPDELRDQDAWKNNKKHVFTGNVKYDFGGAGVVRLNGLYEDETFKDNNTEQQYDIASSAGEKLFFAQEDNIMIFMEKKWEVGGDYENQMGALGNLKALFVSTHTDNTDSILQNEIVGGDKSRSFTYASDSIEAEQVLRVSLSKNLFKKHTIEYGVEAAFNSLTADQEFDHAGIEHSKVTEDRYEVFATHSYKISDKINLQSALNGEFSTIGQSSFGVDSNRSFKFWKPRFEMRYDVSKQDQLRLLVERSASQLNLRNFIAKRNTDDDTIDFGNPNLKPETTWKLSASFEHRFKDDAGSVEAELFVDKISDHIDKIAIDEDSSGVGNIGKATRRGLNLEASIRLGFIGVPNAVLTTTYKYRDTNTVDPFLGVERTLFDVPKHAYTVDFRHNLTDLGMVYGFSMHRRSDMYRTDIYIQQLRTNRHHVSNFYAEYKLSAGMKLRAEIRNPLKDKKRYDKTYYEGNIADGIIDRVEFKRSDVRTSMRLLLQATF